MKFQREGNLAERPFFRVVGDIIRLKATGTLIVQGDFTTDYLSFENGLCVSVDVTGGREDIPLGQLLVNRGYLTPDQVNGLLEEQKKSLVKFGFLARQTGHVTALQLMEVLEDQILLHIAPCFTWPRGLFHFRFEDSVLYDKDSSRPVDLSVFVDVGEEILKNWPWMSKRIAAPDLIPVPAPGTRVLPPGVQLEAFSGPGTPPVVLTPETERVYHLVDGIRSIRSILDSCRQFEYFSVKALIDLEDAGAIQIPLQEKKRETTKHDWDSIISAITSQSKTVLAAIAALVGILVLLVVPIRLLPSITLDAPVRENAILTKLQTQRVQYALVAFYVVNRRFPDFASELIDGGYLMDHDLIDPYGSKIFYKKSKNGYIVACQGKDKVWATADDYKVEEREFQIESGSFFPK